MMALGTTAPNFFLQDVVSGNIFSLADLKVETGIVLFFICNHCPYVIHINSQLVKMANDYIDKGFYFIAINSNDAKKYTEDAPDKMIVKAQEWNYPFPYLYDETQEVAKSYEAACTPDFYVFDKDKKLTYRGQLDDSRPGNSIPLTGKDIRLALDAILVGEKPSPFQRPSIGCNIKWK